MVKTDLSRSRARKARRVEKAAENAALAGKTQSACVGEPCGACDLCVNGHQGCYSPIASKSTAKAPPRRAKPKRAPSRKKLIDGCKKRILGTGGKWSQAVRRRDGKCVMCYKTETLQAHHWLFRRGHSMALAVDIANGATLCYGCHIGRVHHDGDGDFIFRLGDTMTAIVGPAKVMEMRVTAQNPQPLSLEWWQNREDGIDAMLAGEIYK